MRSARTDKKLNVNKPVVVTCTKNDTSQILLQELSNFIVKTVTFSCKNWQTFLKKRIIFLKQLSAFPAISQGKSTTFSGKFYDLFKKICRFLHENLTGFIGKSKSWNVPVKTVRFFCKNSATKAVRQFGCNKRYCIILVKQPTVTGVIYFSVAMYKQSACAKLQILADCLATFQTKMREQIEILIENARKYTVFIWSFHEHFKNDSREKMKKLYNR